MLLPSCLENSVSRGASLVHATAMDVGWREQRKSGVAMFIVIPGHEVTAVSSCLLDVRKVQREGCPVLEGLELRLAVGVIVRYMRTRTTFRDSHIHEELRQRLRCHRATAVRVNRQPLRINALSSDRRRKELLGKLRALAACQPPTNDVATEDIQDYVEVVVRPLLRSEQLGYIPRPYLAGSGRRKLGLDRGRMFCQRAPFARFSCVAQDPIHRRNRSQIHAIIKQRRVDFPHAAIAKTLAVSGFENRQTLRLREPAMRNAALHGCRLPGRGTQMALDRRSGNPQRCAGSTHADDSRQHDHGFLDDCSSDALSPAAFCKSACTFPRTSIVCSAFSSRLCRRSFSVRKRRSSAASGSGRLPRLFPGASP